MFTLGECGTRLASFSPTLTPTPSHFTPSLTFHHLLQALPHDVDVVNVVELIHNVGIMVQVLIPLTSGPVRYGIDLRELFGGKKPQL